MTLKHMKIFIAVCDTGSMTAASKKLYIAQPAVSFAIAELEHHYGQKLFERISNRLHITEAGKQFLQYSRQIVSLFDEMEGEIRHWDTAGTLRIGSNAAIGAGFLTDLLQDFQILHPGVEIQVILEHTSQLENLLLENHLDFAFIEGLPDNKYLTSRKFHQNTLAFLCSPKHAWANQTIPLAALNSCNFLMREKESSERRMLDEYFRFHKIKVNILWQSISQQAILKAVEKGIGVAALSYEVCKQAFSEGRAAPFYPEHTELDRSFYMIYHQKKFLTNLMQDFMDLCLHPFPSG